MRDISPSTRLILIAEFIVAVYMLIALTTSEYESFKVEQYIDEFEARNQEIALENDELKDQYDYYSSPQYQEKIAKQNFGLINPGEEVLIIPEPVEVNIEKAFEDQILDERQEFYTNLENPIKWWYFFFEGRV